MRLFGQEFDPSTLARIRGAIAEDASLSRSELSRWVCEWLDWRGPDGRPCQLSSRKALRALDEQGLIRLPAPFQAPPKAAEPSAADGWTAPVFQGALRELGPVELVAVAGRDPLAGVWRQMMDTLTPWARGRCAAHSNAT